MLLRKITRHDWINVGEISDKTKLMMINGGVWLRNELQWFLGKGVNELLIVDFNAQTALKVKIQEIYKQNTNKHILII